ncbi:hypothetical protein H0H81_001998 [Sphagnurus paluster]|uniref:Uncharacterized protein n=1 Tax=Sphagnurus paluster TaxID=117069 RepID=A0A9P7KHW1_9AGAR|nr:hypothetical protein H0H81_001998 [Sphagnurus paluster]
MYNRLVSDDCDEDTIGTVFKIGEFDPDLHPFFAAASIEHPPAGSESFLPFWDTNVRLLEFLIPEGVSIRQSNQHLDPNYIFVLNNTGSFRGEERHEDSGDAKAVAEKLNWVYDPAPYMLGYYCQGSKMTLVAITASDTLAPNVDDLVTVDLRQRKDRIANIRHMINIASVLPELARLARS